MIPRGPMTNCLRYHWSEFVIFFLTQSMTKQFISIIAQTVQFTTELHSDGEDFPMENTQEG